MRKCKRTAAAVLAVLLAVLLVGCTPAVDEPEIAAVVTVDINPSVEISLDKDRKVISVKALNDDAQAIVAVMNADGAPLGDALRALVRGAADAGYIGEDGGAILVNVCGGISADVKQSVADGLKSALEEEDSGCVLLVQSAEISDEIRKLAEEQGISTCKALFVDMLAGADEELSAESCAALSVAELLVAANELGDGIEFAPVIIGDTHLLEKGGDDPDDGHDDPGGSTGDPGGEADPDPAPPAPTPPTPPSGGGQQGDGGDEEAPRMSVDELRSILCAYAGITPTVATESSASYENDRRAAYGEVYRFEIRHEGYYYRALLDASNGTIFDYSTEAMPVDNVGFARAVEIATADFNAKGGEAHSEYGPSGQDCMHNGVYVWCI